MTEVDLSKVVARGTGAIRQDKTGKGRFDLIDPISDRRIAAVYEAGAAHGARNWELGLEMSSYMSSLKRHLNDYETICLFKRMGLPLDLLSRLNINVNEDHLAQAAWNLKALMHHEIVHPELNDLTAPVVATADVTIKSSEAVPQNEPAKTNPLERIFKTHLNKK